MLPPILRRPGLVTTAYYATFFSVMGVHMPFWPLWLENWGLTASEIAAFTAIGIGVRVVAGMGLSALADRLARWREVVILCALGAAGFFLAHLAVDTKPMLLVVTLAAGAMIAGVSPISEALGVAAARQHDFPYGQARGLGSLGFLTANLVAGALFTQYGIGIALWWIVICLLGVACLALIHPGGRDAQREGAPKLREITRVIVQPAFGIFLVAVAFSQASHGPYYALSAIHWRDLGLSETRIGALWAFSVAVEVVLMVTAGAFIMTRLGPIRAMTIGAAAGLVRWGAMMADPTGLLLWPVQTLHSLTFATSHLGAMAFIAQAIPARYGAAAQGASGMMATGLALTLSTALAGVLYPRLGGLTYGIGFAFSAIGLAFTLWLGRHWRGETLSV